MESIVLLCKNIIISFSHPFIYENRVHRLRVKNFCQLQLNRAREIEVKLRKEVLEKSI